MPFNSNGVASYSPGLPGQGRGYPGKIAPKMNLQPQSGLPNKRRTWFLRMALGLITMISNTLRCNPFRVDKWVGIMTQGSTTARSNPGL